MSAIKIMMEDKSELALMGKFVPVENEDEVRFITNYILTVLNKDDLFSDVDIYKDHLHKYGDSNKVTHIGTNRVMGMPCITFCLENEEVPKPFEEDYGTGNPCAFFATFLTWTHLICVQSLVTASLRKVQTTTTTEYHRKIIRILD